MQIGMIGFSGSGKTTLFNALTGAEAKTGGFGARGAEPNRAVVQVPDARLDRLVEIYNPKKVVRATVTYIDVVGIEPPEGRAGTALDEKLLHAVAPADALMAVVRGFERGGIEADAPGELREIQTELVLTDLMRAEARLERIEKSIGKVKAEEKKQLELEREALRKSKAALEEERPLRGEQFTPDESKVLRAFQFMTAKPLLIVINLGEEVIGEAAAAEGKIEAVGLGPSAAVLACSAESEMEIARIEDQAERREFLESFGIAEPAADRLIRVSYSTLGLISFFTAAPNEVHAWTIRRGESVLRAAGTIHSDMERGFIRADVIGCEELFECGTWAEAKKQGRLGLEGKNYVMKDGDVMEVRFSV